MSTQTSCNWYSYFHKYDIGAGTGSLISSSMSPVPRGYGSNTMVIYNDEVFYVQTSYIYRVGLGGGSASYFGNSPRGYRIESMFVVGTKLYINTYCDGYVYDLDTGTMEGYTNTYPQCRYNFVCNAVMEDKWLVFGGEDNYAAVLKVDKDTFSNQAWQSAGALTYGVERHSCQPWLHYVYQFGGYVRGLGSYSTTVMIYSYVN